MESLFGIFLLVINFLIGIGYCFAGKRFAKLLLSVTVVCGVAGAIWMTGTESWVETMAICGVALFVLAAILLSDGMSSFLLGVVGIYQVATLFYMPSLNFGTMQWMDYLVITLCIFAGICAVMSRNTVLPVVTAVIGAKLLATITVFIVTQYSRLSELLFNVSLGDLVPMQEQITQTAQQFFWPALGVAVVLTGLGFFTQSRLESSFDE